MFTLVTNLEMSAFVSTSRQYNNKVGNAGTRIVFTRKGLVVSIKSLKNSHNNRKKVINQ